MVQTYFRNGDIVPPEFDALLASMTGEKAGLNFDEWPLMQEFLKGENSKMTGHLNTKKYVGWWKEYIKQLPDDKGEVFKQKCVEILENYTLALEAL